MTNAPVGEDDIPSFENLTSGVTNRETYGRVHPAGLPPEKPPGPLRVYGKNPAGEWWGMLAYTDPVLSDELYEQLKDLKGNAFELALNAAYVKYFYRNDRQLPQYPFDFSQIFKE